MKFLPRVIILTALASVVSVSAYAAKNYYKWVDENGVTHYTARKPHDVNAEVISVTTGLPRDDSGQPVQIEDEPAAGAAGGEQTETAASAPADNKDPERCAAAQNNLQIISENNRIRERQEDGSTRFLTPEEIQQRKDLAQRAIDESC